MTNDAPGEKIYELLFKSSAEGLIVADHRGNIVLANARMGEIFGYTVEELCSINVDDLLPGQMRERHKQYRSDYARDPHPRPMGLGYDLIGLRKDGSSVPVEISLNHFNDNGQPKVMALVMDVSVRREQERQIRQLNTNLERRVAERTRELRDSQMLYSLIARNFPNGTINVFDRSFKYVFVEGDELYKHGITSERLVGRYYLDQLPEAIRPGIEQKLQAVLRGENSSFEMEHQGQHYLINTAGLVDEKGEINRILLVEQNITQRRKAEEKVHEALEKEKHLNELKSRFVSLASHEFRTPLSTVLSSLSLIEKYDPDSNDEKRTKHYKRIRASIRHLTNILNDFLSLEKVEAGKVEVHMAEFNLRHLLKELVDQHQEITKTGQTIHFSYTGPERTYNDQNMMRIIVSNLLSNAVKYSYEGGNIWLEAIMDNRRLKLSVADQGIGIPYEDQKHMFDRFFRAKNATNFEGTGLGLNIVKRYLQLLSGDITLESIPGEGTTFHIHIPNHHLYETHTLN